MGPKAPVTGKFTTIMRKFTKIVGPMGPYNSNFYLKWAHWASITNRFKSKFRFRFKFTCSGYYWW